MFKTALFLAEPGFDHGTAMTLVHSSLYLSRRIIVCVMGSLIFVWMRLEVAVLELIYNYTVVTDRLLSVGYITAVLVKYIIKVPVAVCV